MFTPLSSEAFQYTKEDEDFVWMLNLIIVIFSFVEVIWRFCLFLFMTGICSSYALFIQVY